jgi:hypothetical protein
VTPYFDRPIVWGWHGFQVVARRKPDRPVTRKILGPA